MTNLPQPRDTLAIVLGADRYPEDPTLDNPSFKRTAQKFKSYLRSELGIPKDNILYLFNNGGRPSTQYERIRKHLAKNAASRDLIIFYVGHGQPQHDGYFLTIRSTRRQSLVTTAIVADGIAEILRNGFRDGRTYLILDSCFAGKAVRFFQGALDGITREHVENKFPASGTALLAASSATDAAMAPSEYPFTMFSTALFGALEEGIPTAGDRFSFSELADDIQRRIADFPRAAARPELHAPRQRRGNIADVPLFRNKTPRLTRASFGAVFTGPTHSEQHLANTYHFESIHALSALAQLPRDASVKIGLVAGKPDTTHGAFTNANVETVEMGGSHEPDAFSTGLSGLLVAPGQPVEFLGIAPGFQLVAYNVLQSGTTSDKNILEALNHAAENGVRVVVVPLGSSGGRSAIYEHTFKQLLRLDVLTVVAAGNEGESHASRPAAEPGCVGVGSLLPDGNRDPHSNYGVGVDVFAPGFELTVPLLGEGYGGLSGTAVSATLAGGVAALVRAASPNTKAVRAKRVLVEIAQSRRGCVDAMASIARIAKLESHGEE